MRSPSQDHRRYLHLLKGTPRRRIADAADLSRAKIVGQVRYAGQPLTAPLTGTPCAAYEVVVRGQQTAWQEPFESDDTLGKEWQGQAFLLSDGTGEAFVPMTSFVLVIHYFSFYDEGFFRSRDSRASRLLTRLGIRERGLLLPRFLGLGERRISAGQQAAVYGTCTWEANPASRPSETDYRMSQRRLRIEGAPVLVTSDPELLK